MKSPFLFPVLTELFVGPALGFWRGFDLGLDMDAGAIGSTDTGVGVSTDIGAGGSANTGGSTDIGVGESTDIGTGGSMDAPETGISLIGCTDRSRGIVGGAD
jgi:hypothetical protein